MASKHSFKDVLTPQIVRSNNLLNEPQVISSPVIREPRNRNLSSG